MGTHRRDSFVFVALHCPGTKATSPGSPLQRTPQTRPFTSGRHRIHVPCCLPNKPCRWRTRPRPQQPRRRCTRASGACPTSPVGLSSDARGLSSDTRGLSSRTRVSQKPHPRSRQPRAAAPAAARSSPASGGAAAAAGARPDSASPREGAPAAASSDLISSHPVVHARRSRVTEERDASRERRRHDHIIILKKTGSNMSGRAECVCGHAMDHLRERIEERVCV